MPPARTLAQVAAIAGVSRMTVSRVLRHPERVSAETRERVLAAVDTLDYRPNPLISTLMAATRQRRASETTAGIAFLISEPRETLETYEVSAGIYKGARERALRKGYELLPHSLSEERLPIAQLSRIFKARGIEGIIFGPMNSEHSRLAIDLTGLAGVACGYTLKEPAVHVVATHQRALAAQAYTTAQERGYQRVGVVLYAEAPLGCLWLSSIDEVRASSLPAIPPFWLNKGDEAGLSKWLRRWRPDCLISGVLEMPDILRRYGLSAPDDIGLMLLGYTPQQVSLSGFAKNYEAIGATAVDLVALQLHDNERGIPAYRKTILLDAQWSEGTTLRPPFATDREV